MIKKRLLPILAATLMASTGLYAEANHACCEEPCFDLNCECSQYTVHADWIFWAVRGLQLDYAVNYDGSVTIGDVHRVCPEHDHGFRIGIQKGCDEFCFDLAYTHFKGKDRNTRVDNPDGNLSGTLAIEDATAVTASAIQLASAKWELDYDVVDLVACYLWDCHDCFQAGVYTGFKIACIDHTFDVLYSENVDIHGVSNNLDRIHQNNELKGYGGGIGVSGKYHSKDCFDFFSYFGWDLMLAEVVRRFTYKNSGTGGTSYSTPIALNDECWRMLSILNLGIGVQWTLCCTDCWSSSIALGYEAHHWVGAGGFLYPRDEVGDIIIDHYVEDYGFDGLFARFNLTF